MIQLWYRKWFLCLKISMHNKAKAILLRKENTWAELVEMMQSRQDNTISATEKIAFINGFIDNDKMRPLSSNCMTGCGTRESMRNWSDMWRTDWAMTGGTRMIRPKTKDRTWDGIRRRLLRSGLWIRLTGTWPMRNEWAEWFPGFTRNIKMSCIGTDTKTEYDLWWIITH